MLITLSKVPPNISKAFVKVLVVAAYSDTDDFKLRPDVETSLRNWIKAGGVFVDKFGLDREAWKDLTSDLVSGRRLNDDQETVDAAIDLAQSIRKIIKTQLENETAVSREELALIKDFNTVALTEKETTRANAVKRLQKNVSFLRDQSLSKMFSADVGDQDTTINRLRKVTKQLGGQDLSIDQKIRTANKGTDLLREYNRLRGEMNAVPKNFVMNLVRQSGKPYLPVREVADALAQAGIKVHTIPKQFVGYVDDQLKYYTTEGKLLNGTPVGEVKMNPQYDAQQDNTYVAEVKAPMAKNYTRVYTVDYKAGTTKAKFAKVAEFDKKAKTLRTKWLRQFKSAGITSREGVYAMLAELIYQTSARVGGKANKTDGEKTFGITTLLVSHYKTRGKDRIIEYPGKKGQTQKHKLSSSNPNQMLLIEALDEMARGKLRKDNLITFNNRPVSAGMLNKYLRSIGMPNGVTVHKFRTLKGTQLAKIILNKSPLLTRKRGVNATQVNKWLKSALEKVARELGHFSNGKLTVSTAIANYIDPSVLEDFYNKLGIRMPANIEKQAKLIR